jgi:Zn-dependent peptidase ImmA (M78 family)
MLNELDIRPPLDVAELCRRVGESRGKPIRLIPHPIPVPGPFGVWVATHAADYILYQQETSKAHQGHIVLHELGHIIAGHRSDDDDDALLAELYPDVEPDALREQYPDLEPDAVRRALRRTSYDTEQEREAETVATIILEWASVLDRIAPSNSSDATAQRMGTALGDRMGWL